MLAAGSRTLAGLLSDARVMHRVAGLWLTERVGGALSSDSELLDRVKHVGERAIDPMEKSWAARAKGRIEHEVRVQWAERAQELSVPTGERAEVAA